MGSSRGHPEVTPVSFRVTLGSPGVTGGSPRISRGLIPGYSRGTRVSERESEQISVPASQLGRENCRYRALPREELKIITSKFMENGRTPLPLMDNSIKNVFKASLSS